LFLLAFPFVLSAQSSKVVHKVETNNAGEVSVKVKWYSQSLVYPYGVNIYKQNIASLEWVKQNSIPIKRGKKIDKTILLANPSLNQSYSIVKDLPDSQFKGVILLNTLLQSFNSDLFADYLGVYWEDKKVNLTENVKYKIMILDANGSEKLLGESEQIIVKKENEFAPPQQIESKQKRKTIQFKWLPETNRYYGVNVYRKKNTETAYVKITEFPILISKNNKNKEVPEVFYEDVALEEKTTYDYVLKAISFFGEESLPSETFTHSIKDETAPARPFNLHKVDVKMNEVSIAWKNPDYKEPVTINVYRSLKSDTLFEKVNTSALNASDTLFVENVNERLGYYYYVTSVDESGIEAPSNTIFINVVDMQAPETPTGLMAQSDTGKINLTWNSNTEKDLKGYRIYRTVNNDKKETFVLITPEPIKTSYYVDSLPKNAKNNFLYKIAAIDTSYNMSPLSAPVKIRLPDITPPAKPYIKKIIFQDDKLLIQWIPNVDNDLMGYDIYKRSELNTVWEKLNVGLIPKSSSQYKDRAIQANVLYEYYVVATDSSKNSSEKSNLFPFKTYKVDNDNKQIQVELSVKYNSRRKNVQLYWKHNDIDESSLKGYMVFRKLNNGQFVKHSGLLNERIFNDKKLTSGNYSYQVRIYLNSGEVIISNEQNITVE
jgi:uncharacterized protein